MLKPASPPIWETLSEDIFRAILESAIEPKDAAPLSLADRVRLDTYDPKAPPHQQEHGEVDRAFAL